MPDSSAGSRESAGERSERARLAIREVVARAKRENWPRGAVLEATRQIIREDREPSCRVVK
jgi:hypothetical protein